MIVKKTAVFKFAFVYMHLIFLANKRSIDSRQKR